MKRFERVQEILEKSVNGDTIGGPHGNFWRGLTIDEFKMKKVVGKALVVLNKPDDSNLVKALEGTAPFDGTQYPRMPVGYDPVKPGKIAYIRQWIADGCPDDDEVNPPADDSVNPPANP